MAFVHISKILEYKKNAMLAVEDGMIPCTFCCKRTTECPKCKYTKYIQEQLKLNSAEDNEK